MHTDRTIAWLAAQIERRTMQGIAVDTAALIRAGAIPVGTQLPPVRDLAEALGVSPATVSGAWKQLRTYRLVSGAGRTGIWVCGDQGAQRPARFESIGNFGENIVAELSMALPDPALAPALGPALIHATHTEGLNSYKRDQITAVLRDAVLPRWPFVPEALVATNGGFEAVYLALQTVVLPGAPVAVEDPTAVRILDILDKLGAHRIPVRCDADGPEPASLAAALSQRPVAFLYQPRTHSVTGVGVGTARFDELAALLKDNETIIVEDDGLGDIAGRPPASLGERFPDRTVHIRSFSKSFGPDLRLAVLSAPAKIADGIQAYRNFGAGWTSRILQAAAAFLLTDAGTETQLALARETYRQRRHALVLALSRHGVTLPAPDSRDGLCVWVPVESERFALVTLAARGIAVHPGDRFYQNIVPHIRVGTGLPISNVDDVAKAIALACGSKAASRDRQSSVIDGAGAVLKPYQMP
jgi:DNA-binding transcriptional MocR family regulator